jgi:hypothetical protein
MELLVASGADSAYDGCFTKTILHIFRTGRDIAGEHLLCADLAPAISDRCWRSQSQYLAYSGSNLSGGDPGLWLVPNIARCRDAVTGRPTAGLVDQLTAGVIVTDSMRETLTAMEESGSARLRLVIGAAGSGKSTLLALFIRPRKARALGADIGVADDYIKAAAFLDSTSTLESVAAELAAQLTTTVPGFEQAAAAVTAELTEEKLKTLGSWEISVMRPLARCRAAGRVHLIVDGLDQPESGAREVILAALRQLTYDSPAADLGHVRVIAGVRSGENVDIRSDLVDAYRIDVTPPSLAEIAQAATSQLGLQLSENDLARVAGDGFTGGWLIARLVREIAETTAALCEFGDLGELIATRARAAARSPGSPNPIHMLSVIAAAGAQPVLPIRLLARVSGGGDNGGPMSRIRNAVVKCGALISRGKPGTDHETLGISHLALLEPVSNYARQCGYDPSAAHQAIIDTCQHLAAHRDGDSQVGIDDVIAYWNVAAPRHYLAVGNPTAAIQFLTQRESARAADNRDRWVSWLPAITAQLGDADRETLAVRHKVADWRGEAGDAAGAVAELQALLVSAVRVLGPDDSGVLIARQDLARWQGAAGDPAGAAAATEQLLPDVVRVLGPDHPETLKTRRENAFWRGIAGDPAVAAAATEQLLPDVVRVLGPDHPDTLTIKFLVAYWRGEAGDVAGAISALEQVVSDRIRVLGPDHPDTFSARGTLAYWQGEAGNPGGAAAATEQLLADRVRVLGPDHPRTLATRHNLALWRGDAGDPAGAAAELGELVTDERRVLGPDHPYTLATRSVLALWRGERGDPSGAAAETSQLLADCLRVLGPDHPDTLATRHNLAIWRGEAGDPAGAADALGELLSDYLRVRGPNHPDTRGTRHDLLGWQSAAAGATGRPSGLLPARGPDQPDSAANWDNLAHWRHRTSL